jgi:tetratricopeptide (TPR) repeat protein
VALRSGATTSDERVPEAARESFQLGRHLLESPDLSRRAAAVTYLEEATRLAPTSSRVHAYLADALLWAGRAEAAAKESARALELDDQEPHALLIGGIVSLVQSWDWERAEGLVRRAVRRKPDDAAYTVVLAFVLSTAGRGTEAIALLDRARTLDPVTALVRADIGLMYLYAGQTRKAAEACEEASRLAPEAGYAHSCATYARATVGDLEVARAHARTVIRLAGGNDTEVLGPDSVAADGALMRYRDWQAERFAADLSAGFGAALAFAQAGRSVRALAALENAGRRRDMGFVTITVDPRFAALRADPAFQRLAAPIVAKGAAWPPS